jgi:hypothetical protein
MNQEASPDLQSQHPSTVAGIFCVVLLGLAGVVSWLYLPIEGRVSGLRLAILHPWFSTWPHIPPITLFSFGGLALAISLALLILMLTPWRHLPLPWLTLSLFVWVLGYCFCLRLANRMDDLTYLWDQRQQLDVLLSFARSQCGAKYWQPSLGTFNEMDFGLHGLMERLFWNREFFSWGVLFLLLGGVLTLAIGIRRVPMGQRKWWIPSMGLLLVLIISLASVNSVIRDRRLQQASDAISSGQDHIAQQLLDHLGNLSPDLWGWPPFLYLMGEAQCHLGLESPAQHFFMGAKLMPKDVAKPKFAQGEVGKIRLEWSQTKASLEPSICGIAGQMLGWALVLDGLNQYQAPQAIAAAKDSWAMAQSFSPEQLQAPFLLAKARSELRISPDSLANSQAFLNYCDHRYLKSLAYTLAGDSSYQMRTFAVAREHYFRAFDIYHYMNYLPFRGLSGQ